LTAEFRPTLSTPTRLHNKMTDTQMTNQQAEALVSAVKKAIAEKELKSRLHGTSGTSASDYQRIFDDDEYMKEASEHHLKLSSKQIKQFVKNGAGLPFLHDYKADGTTEPIIPLGATKLQRGAYKNIADIEGRKWSAQARLRRKLQEKGLESKLRQEILKDERNFFVQKGADVICELKTKQTSKSK
jgi:hypothetical protein